MGLKCLELFCVLSKHFSKFVTIFLTEILCNAHSGCLIFSILFPVCKPAFKILWLMLDDRCSIPRIGWDIFLLATASRLVLGPTQPPIQWGSEFLSEVLKWRRREADHSFPSSSEVVNGWSYTSTPTIRLHGVVLNSAQGLLYLFLWEKILLTSQNDVSWSE